MPFSSYGLNWTWSMSMYSGDNSGMWGKRRGSPRVNFANQIGIYVLHNADEAFYVGRTGKGDNAGFAARLYGHHYTKKRGKWDSFSWFGFRPVRASGTLVRRPMIQMKTEDVIGDIEALLIYLLDPKSNGSPGKYKHMLEYQQVGLTE